MRLKNLKSSFYSDKEGTGSQLIAGLKVSKDVHSFKPLWGTESAGPKAPDVSTASEDQCITLGLNKKQNRKLF